MKNILVLLCVAVIFLFGDLFFHPAMIAMNLSGGGVNQHQISESIPQTGQPNAADSLRELRQYKSNLMVIEFSLRHENMQNQENLFITLRILLLIIVIGSIMFIYIKAKSSHTDISRLALLALIIILISVYWYDNFVLDAQSRINDRVDTIPYLLNRVPLMSGDELRALPIFEEITWPIGISAKVQLFFRKPNFAQAISYGPVVAMLVILILRRQMLKKSKPA
jgi:hypothetical protein